jgi:hypothetical protein
MNRVELKHISVRPANPFAGWQNKVHRVVLVLFFVALILVWVRLWAPAAVLGQASWPDGLLVVMTAATTLASLSRQLPAQNVVLAAVVIGGFAGAVVSLGALTGVPFGPVVFNPVKIGRLLFNLLPWAVPVMWVVAILTSRGVARLVLRPYRQRANYGFGVMGLTLLLVVLLELSFEPYATQVKQYWSWKPTRIASDWYTTPWINFLGWAVTTLVILLFVTPALINKIPTKMRPVYHPLIMWEVMSCLFLTGTVVHHLWAAAILSGAQMVVVATLSVLGAKRQPVSGRKTEPRA